MQNTDNSIHQRIAHLALTIGPRMSGTAANQHGAELCS